MTNSDMMFNNAVFTSKTLSTETKQGFKLHFFFFDIPIDANEPGSSPILNVKPLLPEERQIRNCCFYQTY